MRRLYRMMLAACCIALMACGGESKKPLYYSESPEEFSSYASQGDEVEVPFRSKGNVKYVSVSVNGVGLEMIFDTGCSATLISIAEANYLYQKGKLSINDVKGMVQSTIADGSITEDMVVNLREVIIDNQILYTNVLATVSGNVDAPLLLGNSVLDRNATVTIDNEKNVLRFKIK